MRTRRSRIIGLGAAAICLALAFAASAAHADISKKVQRALRGKLILTAAPIESPEGSEKQVIAAYKKAGAKKLTHVKGEEGIPTWEFHFIAFMKKKPQVTQLSIDFYDRKKQYVANKRMSGIDPTLQLVQGALLITEDDGLKVGGSYTVKLTASVKGKDVVLATTNVVLK